MSGSFRVYIIKCLKTNKCYVSYTDSDNKNYNPLSYLNSVYRKNKDKYIELGKSIEEHGMKQHSFMFVKENLSKDKASELTTDLREKMSDRSLHDSVQRKESFLAELALIENDEPITDI